MADRVQVDLFGHPAEPWRETRGRPRFKPTDRQRALARMMFLHGAKQPEIAAALGIRVPTLVRHFGREIGSQSALANCYQTKGNHDAK